MPTPSRWKLIRAAMVPAWGRAVLAILGSMLVTNLVGLGDVSGYAMIPGIYLALSPVVGSVALRAGTVALATMAIAAVSFIGAELSTWIVATTIGLAVVGFVIGLLPRAGPRAAAVQLPLLTAFAYSAGQPLADASAASRAAAILVALPVYVLASAVVFQTDQRRPLLLGAAAALGGVARALGHVAAGAAGAATEAERGLVQFRVATGRLKDAAVPVGGSLDSRAGRLLTMAVQQAVAAAELLASEPRKLDGRRRGWVVSLSKAAGGLAAALVRSGPLPSPVTLNDLASQSRADGDATISSLAAALADASRAVAVLHGKSRELPGDAVAELPGALARLRGALTPDDPAFRRAVRLAAAAALVGLVAGLSGLGRTYWAVFAVVVILNAPAALDWRRGLMRIGGTVAGFLLALPLVALVGGKSLLALVIGLALLLPGLLLMPVNYGYAVVFITCTIAMLFSSSGEEADFLRYRIAENAIGVAVVCGIGLLLWRTRRDDWWRSARLMAGSLAGAFGSSRPQQHRDELVTRALALRTETVEVEAVPGTAPAFAAAWTYLAASEDLIRILIGPHAKPPSDPAAAASRLQTIEDRCRPDSTPPPSIPDARSEAPRTLVDQEITRMAGALATLQQHP